MERGEHQTLALRILVGADPIEGTLSDDRGACWPFVGWLGLARALETALAPPRSSATAEPQEDPPWKNTTGTGGLAPAT